MKKCLCILLILMLMLPFSASSETNVPEAGSVVVFGRMSRTGIRIMVRNRCNGWFWRLMRIHFC